VHKSSLPPFSFPQVKKKLASIPAELKSAGNRDVINQLVIHYDKKDRVTYVESEKSELYSVFVMETEVFSTGLNAVMERLLGSHSYVETEKRRTFVVPHLDVVVGVDERGASVGSTIAGKKRIELIGAGGKDYFRAYLQTLKFEEKFI